MCGICGIYRFKAPEADDAGTVSRMCAELERRGPDDQGVAQAGRATLGNRRLAILDLTAAGHQPMTTADGRFTVTFNGEIYNHRDLAREMGLGPGELRSRADTEILLHAWVRWGPDALDRLVGQWAFAVHDRETDAVWLARDRFGEKPLFYHRSPDALSFASSIASLTAAPWVPREIDPDTLREYLTLRYVVAPRTVLKDVAKLPPGHLLRVASDGLKEKRWYAPHFATDGALARRRPDELAEQFDALFTQAASRCLESDVPVALFLSDGIDSNGIYHALLQGGHEVPAYTFTPVQEGAGPSVGEVTDTGATEIRVPAGVRLASMAPAFASLTEPVGDGAALATWLLVRGAREKATVFLCGHGGDEVLGGYRLSYDRFRVALLRSLAWLPASWMRTQADRYVHGDEEFGARWARLRRLPRHRAPDAMRYLIHKPLPDADLRELTGASGATEPALATVDRLYAASDGKNDLDRIQEVLLHTFLSANLLVWADAVAMDASAELRLPFLDRDLVDFALSLPPTARVSRWPGRANTKQILRRWGRDRLDQEVLRRGKHGFPFGNLPQLLASDGDALRAMILDQPALRRELPGLESWLGRPPERFGEPWEGTLWALLALAAWGDRLRIF